MRKHCLLRLTAMLLACILLIGCSAPGQQAAAAETASSGNAAEAPAASAAASAAQTGKQLPQMHRQDYPCYIGSLDYSLTEPFPLYFADGADDLPYVELYSWAELLYFLNHEYVGDSGYELTIFEDGDKVRLERENDYTLEIDFNNSTLVFDDYDAFIHRSDDTTLIDLVSESGFNESGEAQLFQRDKQASFDRYGDMLTVDLAAYGIDLIALDGAFYLPLQTMNDFLLSPMRTSFLFNGKALILANDDTLFDYDENVYTDLADFYYSVPPKQRSDALAEYSYNELCLVLDSLYGLKGPHDIQSFRKLFWQIGYDEALSGNDPVDADNALKAFIDYYLDDLHSVFNEYSWMAGLRGIPGSTGISNRKFDEHENAFNKARAQFYPDGCPGYEEVGNTAFVTFDSFRFSHVGDSFYAGRETGEIPNDTLGLIIYAHRHITRENSPIENVVLDLSNNTGGDVDAAIFVLGWLLGDAPISVKDMMTGAMSTAVYRADVNLDRQFDEKDTVQDKNLYCLISPVSFSCGNLIPAALKSSQKVTLIGRTSGGGSCVVQPLSTAYGTVFQISSAMRISFLKNGSFYDVDQGVEPDHYISNLASYYDRKVLTDFINGLI